MEFWVVFYIFEKSEFIAIFMNAHQSYVAKSNGKKRQVSINAETKTVKYSNTTESQPLTRNFSKRFLKLETNIPFRFWNIQAPGSVGNHLGFGFGPASGLIPKKGNHYKSSLIIIKLLFQKLCLPYQSVF